MPIHTTLHTRNIPIRDQGGTLVSAQLTRVGMYLSMYWHGAFGMYNVMIPVNTSKYINTYHNVHGIPFFLYIPILVNKFKYMQSIPYTPMLTNTE